MHSGRIIEFDVQIKIWREVFKKYMQYSFFGRSYGSNIAKTVYRWIQVFFLVQGLGMICQIMAYPYFDLHIKFNNSTTVHLWTQLSPESITFRFSGYGIL